MIKGFRFKFIIALFIAVLFVSALMPVKLFAIEQDEFLRPDQFDNYTDLADANVPGTTNQAFRGTIIKAGGVILDIVRVIALSWGVLMLISIAIKYMSGNSQVKAQLKTDIPTYLTGAVILFGSAGLLTLIKYFVFDTLG